MAILQIRAQDVSSMFEGTSAVSVDLCDANGTILDGFEIATGTPVLSGRVWSLTADGLDLELIPNADITPPNTGYLVRIGDNHPFVIVKGSATENLQEALAVQPGPLGPIEGARGPRGFAPWEDYTRTEWASVVPEDGVLYLVTVS